MFTSSRYTLVHGYFLLKSTRVLGYSYEIRYGAVVNRAVRRIATMRLMNSLYCPYRLPRRPAPKRIVVARPQRAEGGEAFTRACFSTVYLNFDASFEFI